MDEKDTKLISLQVDKEFLDKAKKRAKSIGLTLSAYFRICVAKDLQAAEKDKSDVLDL
jgi:antitoxin component of RelBE/YafQ-DinJ toxin-antitoxin module